METGHVKAIWTEVFDVPRSAYTWRATNLPRHMMESRMDTSWNAGSRPNCVTSAERREAVGAPDHFPGQGFLGIGRPIKSHTTFDPNSPKESLK